MSLRPFWPFYWISENRKFEKNYRTPVTIIGMIWYQIQLFLSFTKTVMAKYLECVAETLQQFVLTDFDHSVLSDYHQAYIGVVKLDI